MDRSYWLAREKASKILADHAPSKEAQFAHLEFERLYRAKCADLEILETPGPTIPDKKTSQASEQPVAPEGLRGDRRWSSQELAVLRSLIANGETIAGIASRMRRTKQSVQNRLATQMARA